MIKIVLRKVLFPALSLFFLLLLLLNLNIGPSRTDGNLYNKSALTLFEKSSSPLNREELKKFLKAANFKKVSWRRRLREDLKDFDYLILSKSALESREREIIVDFLRSGGGLVLFLSEDYDQEFLKELGLRGYTVYAKNPKIRYNSSFLKEPLEGKLSSQRGLLLKTGYGGDIREPDRGNIFPERIAVRDFNILSQQLGREGELLGVNMLLVKHWMNPWDLDAKVPPRWLLFSFEELDLTAEDYNKIAGILSKEAVIKDLRADMPLYHIGEDISLTLDIFNPLNSSYRIELLIELYKDNRVVYSRYQKKSVREGISALNFEVKRELEPGFYKIRCSLSQDGQVYDQSYNGFLVIDQSWKDRGSGLKVEDNQLLFNGSREFLWGINYYESKRGELHWVWPNPYYIERDFALMSRMGFKIVRIHYHHPKWFKDYLSLIGSDIGGYFPDKGYLPDEYDLRILDSFIYLAKMHGLVISFDLFTLVPLEMGNPLGWLAMTERITDRERVENQLEFIRIIAERYKDVKGISWDLWNEPRVPEDYRVHLKEWVKELRAEFKDNGDNHLITLGGNDSLFLEEYLDYTSYHTYNVLDRVSSVKPLILQEFWLPKGLDQELEQLEELRIVIEDLKESDYQGFMPWQWTRQSRLWDRSGPEEWDNDLGLFLREDSSLKPTAELFLGDF